MARLTRALNKRTDVPHILLTHSPVYGLPVAQTGLPEIYHAPAVAFTAQIRDLAGRHENLRSVLGAHTHMNMRVNQGSVEFVTVSALVETPFEFKLFEVTPRRMTMSTLSLRGALAFESEFEGEYDTGRSFVQGRDVDRSFSKAFGTGQNGART
jgi:hypothetical protein